MCCVYVLFSPCVVIFLLTQIQMRNPNNIWKLIKYKTIIYYFSHFTRHQIVWLTKDLLWCYCIKIHETLRKQNWLQGVLWQTGTFKFKVRNIFLQRCVHTQWYHLMMFTTSCNRWYIAGGINFGRSAPLERNPN